ncbi:MAG: LPS export ABC transporter periplasmic protein LptC [Candidatus Cloacimonadota bacterium]|nr:LPS export ABC transporter periplasmic protein LptC [Candidatus Cloacimonadota bacterium]
MRIRFQILFYLIFLILSGCNNEKQFVSKIKFENLPDEIVDSVYTIQTNIDKTERKIIAKTFMRFYEKNVSIADSLTITNFDEFGKLKYEIYCDSAFINEKENIFNAYGNVFVKNKEASLSTEFLKWDRNTNKLFSPEYVKIDRKNSILEGYNLKTDMKLENFELTKVRAEGDLSEENIDY